MILGLSGYKGSGKDTAAAYLVKEHGFERKAFADPLKKSVAALLDIPFHEIDKLKNAENTSVDLLVNYGNVVQTMTFREFLQRYGTESHRDIFGENFWVDLTLPVQGFYPGRAIVVTDVRFASEANRINLLGGYTVWIDRLTAKPLPSEKPHSSEQFQFECDFSITNDGILSDLYEGIEAVLDSVGSNALG